MIIDMLIQYLNNYKQKKKLNDLVDSITYVPNELGIYCINTIDDSVHQDYFISSPLINVHLLLINSSNTTPDYIKSYNYDLDINTIVITQVKGEEDNVCLTDFLGICDQAIIIKKTDLLQLLKTWDELKREKKEKITLKKWGNLLILKDNSKSFYCEYELININYHCEQSDCDCYSSY